MNNRYLLAIAVVISLSLNGMIAYGIDEKNENDMINELIKTGQFTEDEAKDFVSKTMQNEQEDNNNQTSMKPTGKFEKIIGVYSEVIFFPNMTLNFPNMTSSR